MNYEPHFAFLYNIQGGQLVIIVLAILVLFGSKRLPDIAKTFGKALHEFRKAAADVNKEIQQASSDTPPPPAASNASDQTKESKEKVVV